MKRVDRVLTTIEDCIRENTYQPVEDEKLELKNSPSLKGDWKEIYKTVSAFLNTSGGILLIGIKEDIKNKRYIFKNGYTDNIEPKIKDIANAFTDKDGKKVDVKNVLKSDVNSD